MSDYDSESSRPATPVGPLPDIPNSRPAYRFNWDHASRRPGPASISETTEGRGDYFDATPKVDIYGASTTNLVSTNVSSEWSSSKHGFHGMYIPRCSCALTRTAICSYLNCSEQSAQVISTPEGSCSHTFSSANCSPSRPTQGFRSVPSRNRS